MAASDALLARIDALFPDGEHQPPAVQLRRAIALWLASSPRPEVGECAALLTTLGSYLRQSQAHLWLDPDQRWPKLKAFLEDPDSQGAFWVQEVQDVAVRLNLKLLMPPPPPTPPAPPSPTSPASLSLTGDNGAGNGHSSTSANAKGFGASAMAYAASKRARDLAQMVFPAALKTAGSGWRLISDPSHRLRRAVAMWLADTPAPGMGPHQAPLTWAGEFVRRPEHAELWLEVASKFRSLDAFLLDGDSRGAFRVETTPASPSGLVLLDLEAMQGLVHQPTAMHAAKTVAGAAVGAAGPEGARGPVANALASLAPSAEAIVVAAAAAWPGESPQCVLRRQAAVELAAARPFPGVGNLENAMLLARLGETLLRAKPKAAARLKTDMGGKVQWLVVLTSNGGAELITEQEATAAMAAAGTAAKRDPYSHFLLRVVKGDWDRVGVLNVQELLRRYGSGGSGAGGGGATAGASSTGGQQQQQQPQKQKLTTALGCAPETTAEVKAALASLFRARSSGKAGEEESEELRLVALLLMQAGPPHLLTFAKLGAEVPKLLRRACPGLRLQCIGRPDVFEVVEEVRGRWVARLVCPRLLQLVPVSLPQSQPPKQDQPKALAAAALGRVAATAAQGSSVGSAAAVASGSGAPSALLQGKSLAELTHMAFPLRLAGNTPAPDKPARQLRQAIAEWLAGSPYARALGPVRAKLSHIGHFLVRSQAALWRNPAHKFPKLKDLLASGDSRGVFLLAHDSPGDSDPVVQLCEQALQAAAAALLEARGQSSVGGGGGSGGAAAGGAAGAGTEEHWRVSGGGFQVAPVELGPEAPAWPPDPPGALPALVAAAPSTSLEVAAAAAGASGNSGDFTQPLPDAGVCVVADPYGEQLIAMLQHCGCCTRIGLAVQAHGGRPALVSLYAPPALMQMDGAEEGMVQWPAAVYLIDPLAAAAAYGGGADGDAAAAALLCSLQPLLEAPSVAKVVHGGVGAGGNALACLEAVINMNSGREATAALAYPVLDTSLVLASVEAMLGLQHTPQLQASQPAGPDSGIGWLRGLHTHVARLRDALASTGLWADRPQLLAALTARHFAALREDAQAALGATRVDDDAAARLLTRPLGPSQMEVAARCARHLPELWTALVQEAVPWVAAHASAAAMVGYRQQQAVAARSVVEAPWGTH
ncbi:hypothetical protein HXX76_013203 [Chlamydomonas incerta]|uniref:Uncharacterized protein n=1 Tax=Chlamydomonas incerta TaxID=51695 RepID=A0A835VUR3_CHLIN|nr:hypothetical protein HXX76_013203 [Chlamydomonas incerta]|eukprot:KAG2426224.1 hypothetical protein HXX76_013203 [Chlamydomonas incerta]